MNSLLATLFSGILYLFCWPSEKDRLNAQMAELCAKDGGTKVYETVQLPAEMFDQFGRPKFSTNEVINMPKNMRVVKLGDEYTYIIESTFIEEGDPWKNQGSLTKAHYKILRNSNKKIMADSIEYSRHGGERWFPGHPGASSCPLDAVNIIQIVFVRPNIH